MPQRNSTRVFNSGRGRVLSLALVVLTAASQHEPARAAYPEKPVTLIVPFAAGGANNAIARIIAQELTAVLGQSVVVDNRAGAGGALGSDMVAKSAPDGYTILIASSAHAINPSVHTQMPFNTLTDFAPVMQLTKEAPYVVIVGEAQPIRNIKDVIALAKTKSGAVSYASSGNGGAPHLAGALLGHMAGVELTHVPYKGGGPALVDVMRGEVTLYFASLTTALPQIKAGKVRAIAVSSASRSSHLPNVPTIVESGVPGFVIASWYGILAPAKTPQPIVDQLNAALTKVMASPAIQTRLAEQGEEANTGTPDAFNRYIAAETVKFAKIVEVARIPRE